jgi:hypothetical protein
LVGEGGETHEKCEIAHRGMKWIGFFTLIRFPIRIGFHQSVTKFCLEFTSWRCKSLQRHRKMAFGTGKFSSVLFFDQIRTLYEVGWTQSSTSTSSCSTPVHHARDTRPTFQRTSCPRVHHRHTPRVAAPAAPSLKSQIPVVRRKR